jgi:HEAT repeat protein
MVAYFRELHAETGDEACAPALLALASSQFEESWRPALVALREMGDARTAKALVRRLETTEVVNSPRTLLALAALGGIGSEDSIPFLVNLLGHESREVGRSASRALVEIGPASVPEALVAFEHIDRQNRLMAALTLSYLGDSKGREAVRRFLGTVRSDDEETLGEIRRNLMH